MNNVLLSAFFLCIVCTVFAENEFVLSEELLSAPVHYLPFRNSTIDDPEMKKKKTNHNQID